MADLSSKFGLLFQALLQEIKMDMTLFLNAYEKIFCMLNNPNTHVKELREKIKEQGYCEKLD